jgi:hypothetical protein
LGGEFEVIIMKRPLFKDVIALYEWWKPKVLELVDTACLLVAHQPEEDMQIDGQDEKLSEDEAEDEIVEEAGSAPPKGDDLCLKFKSKRFNEFERVKGRDQMRVSPLLPTIMASVNENVNGKVETTTFVEAKIPPPPPERKAIPMDNSILVGKSIPLPPPPPTEQNIPAVKLIPLPPPPPPPPTKTIRTVASPVSFDKPIVTLQIDKRTTAVVAPTIPPPNPFTEVCIRFVNPDVPGVSKSTSIPLRGYFLCQGAGAAPGPKLTAWPGDREW